MIRAAEPQDFSSIEAIREPYVLDLSRIDDAEYRFRMQKSGFIGQLSSIEFQEDLHHLFLVSQDENGIEGYLRIDRDHEYQDDDEKIWLLREGKECYFSSPHAEIGMIGVREDRKGQGVGKMLLDEAIHLLSQKDIENLFSLVVLSPLTNIPSLLFHEKNTFERIAVSSPHQHFELNNYQSLLYRRPL